MAKNLFLTALCAVFMLSFVSCSSSEHRRTESVKKQQQQLEVLLNRPNLDDESRYAIINQIAGN
jgi:hypothetical protein